MRHDITADITNIHGSLVCKHNVTAPLFIGSNRYAAITMDFEDSTGSIIVTAPFKPSLVIIHNYRDDYTVENTSTTTYEMNGTVVQEPNGSISNACRTTVIANHYYQRNKLDRSFFIPTAANNGVLFEATVTALTQEGVVVNVLTNANDPIANKFIFYCFE